MFTESYGNETELFSEDLNNNKRFEHEKAKIKVDHALMEIAEHGSVGYVPPGESDKIRAIARIPTSEKAWSHVVVLREGNSQGGLRHATEKHFHQFHDAGLIEPDGLGHQSSRQIMNDLFRRLFAQHIKGFVFKQGRFEGDLRVQFKAEVDGCPIRIVGSSRKFDPSKLAGSDAEGISNRGKTIYTELITMFPQQQKMKRRSVPAAAILD